MIYTALTKKALTISFNAHKNQLDKNGAPYVFHPFHLAEQMDDENSVCTALLHDIIEDTDITLDDLKKEGFPPAVTQALALLCHEEGVEYFDYIRGIKNGSALAVKVKLADLRHNSDITRLDKPSLRDFQRTEKYLKAIEILSAE